MKEFAISLKGESLRAGLRKSYRQGRNSLGLTECQNIKVVEEGLVPYDPLVMPISSDDLHLMGLTLSWPNPQLIQGKEKTFLVHDAAIYLVDESNWTLYPLDIYDHSSLTATNPVKNGLWQLADMGEAWLLVNGVSSVFHHGRHIMKGETDKVYHQKDIRVQAACVHNGHMVMAGFDPDHFWTTAWQVTLDSWIGKNIKLNHGVDTTLKMGYNFVLWTSLSFDPFWLFYPSLSQTGILNTPSHLSKHDYGTEDGYPYLFDAMNRGEIGWVPMEWPGRIFQVKPLGKAVIIYGENGISALVPTVDPVPSLVAITLHRIGINNVGAAGGSETYHVFIDQEGELWSIDADLKMGRLGYKEFFQSDLDTKLIVNHERHDDEFYICNGSKLWLLTKHGLSTAKQVVTSVGYHGGYKVNLGSELTDANLLWTLGEFDNGASEIDTIQWVKIGANLTYSYEVAIDYKYTDAEAFTRSDWKPVNDKGAVFMGIGGKSFRVAIRTIGLIETTAAEPPDWVDITFKRTDRRFTRGISTGDM